MAIEHGPFMVSFPGKNCYFPWLCKRLPESMLVIKKGAAMGDSTINLMNHHLRIYDHICCKQRGAMPSCRDASIALRDIMSVAIVAMAIMGIHGFNSRSDNDTCSNDFECL